MRIALLFYICLALSVNSFAQGQQSPPKTGNPILPGYFADPTIKKFGDTYYIYATTDNEMLASGVPTVWYSHDFQNWYNYTMEVPSLSSVNLRNFWAPDIVKGDDGRFYLYFGNCQAGCNIYGYVSDSPIGSWGKLHEDDTPVISHGYPREGFPSLDAQFFRDEDGKIYAYWGTWVHYNNGYAVGELDAENMSVMKDGSKNIPLSETPEPFEAAYMMKKGDKYILMYSGASCHDETYNVRYSYADTPYGPFTPGENNPILSTNDDQTVHGPGHHSVLQEGDDFYIVYHKHDYPMTRGGLSRQVCVDKMIFENDSTIKAVVPVKEGIAAFGKSDAPEDLAFGATATASSYYELKTPEHDYAYQPSHVTDHDNATMWKAGDNSFPQNLTLDLGAVKKINRVMTQFEFAGYYYQYKIEYSKNGEDWKLYADRSDNRTPCSPMIDDQKVKARYLKLTVLGSEKTGLYAAVWNMKVYGSLFELPLDIENKASKEGPGVAGSKRLLVDIDADKVSEQNMETIANGGELGGSFVKSGALSLVQDDLGVKAFQFDKGALTLDQEVPASLEWNGAYTIATWVRNPEIGREGECLASWCDRFEFQLANSFNALFYNSSNYGAAAHLDGHFDMRYQKLPAADDWHYIVLTFDGVVEKIYVDGVLDNMQIMSLSSATDKAKIRIGASDIGENYTGFMNSLQMYDYALGASEILKLMKESKPNP